MKFIQYQPAICQYSVPPVVIIADTIEELLKNDYFNSCCTDENEFFCYSDNTLMIQRKDRRFWWVLGFIKEFDLEKSGLPKFNPYMYDE